MSDIVVDLDQELLEVEEDTLDGNVENIEDEAEVEASSDFDIPEKFKGKSVEDVVKSYKELEKEFGRKNNEVGELRSLADKLLQQELGRSNDSPVKKEKVTFDDLVETPEEAISGIVNDRVKSLEEKFELASREAALAKLQIRHPDLMDIDQDSSFHEWINASKFRQKQAQAIKSGDYEVADDLLSEWKERQSLLKQTVQKDVTDKVSKNLKKVTTESGGTGETSKKIYSRSQLMNLRLTNPAKYEAMQPEIERAYAEGRVR